jgi:predicted RecA/RadA family phage recombinase
MKNYIQPGEAITIPAPAAVVSGAGVTVGSLFGVANADAANGEPVVLSTVGVFELPKVAADAIAVGEPIYFDAGEASNDDSAGIKVGVALAAAGAGVTTVTVRLNGSF